MATDYDYSRFNGTKLYLGSKEDITAKVKADATINTYFSHITINLNRIVFSFTQAINQALLDTFIANYDPYVMLSEQKSLGHQIQLQPTVSYSTVDNVYTRVAYYEFKHNNPNTINGIHSVDIVTTGINSPTYTFKLLDVNNNTVLGTSGSITTLDNEETTTTISNVSYLPKHSNTVVELQLNITTTDTIVEIVNVTLNFNA